MAKASKSCTQLIIFLCTFPWLLWSFSSIHENYKHVIIICEWNSHKTIEKIFLIIACFAQSPSSKFGIYRVKVTATERPQLEWRVRGGPGAQLQKRLLVYPPPSHPPLYFSFCLKEWTPFQLFLSPLIHSKPTFGNIDPFSLTPGASHQSRTDFTRPLSCLHFSWRGQKKPGYPRSLVFFSCMYFQIP